MKKNRLLISIFLLFISKIVFADLMDSYESEKITPKKPDNNSEKKEESIHDSHEKNKALKPKKAPATESIPATKPSKNKPAPINPEKKGEKKRAPVHFQGLGLTGLKKEGMVQLHQNVVVTQEDFHLESDEAKMYLENESNEVKEVLAEGRVKITKVDEATGKLVKANGDFAEFDNATQLITLRGNAKVVKGDDVITGSLIYYNLKTGWIKVEKVKGVVNP